MVHEEVEESRKKIYPGIFVHPWVCGVAFAIFSSAIGAGSIYVFNKYGNTGSPAEIPERTIVFLEPRTDYPLAEYPDSLTTEPCEGKGVSIRDGTGKILYEYDPQTGIKVLEAFTEYLPYAGMYYIDEDLDSLVDRMSSTISTSHKSGVKPVAQEIVQTEEPERTIVYLEQRTDYPLAGYQIRATRKEAQNRMRESLRTIHGNLEFICK